MVMLIAGLIVFFGSHSVEIVAPHWHERAVLRLGELTWKSVYSVLSIAGFVLLVAGYAHVHRLTPQLYVPASWMYHVVWVLMLPVFPLLIAAYLPGHIRRTTRHPMLVAIKLWATAHLLVNGSLAAVLLFGSFLIWAIIDRIAVKRRGKAAVVINVSGLYDVIAVIGGLGLYALTVFRLHRMIIGVSPIV